MKRERTTPNLPAVRQLRAGVDLVVKDATARRLALAHLKGTARNTARAYRADLAAFWTWAGKAESYPITPARLLDYVAEHAPGKDGGLSIATLSRRVAAISTRHRLQGIPDALNPCRHPQVKAALSALRRESAAAGNAPHKARALTLDALRRLLDVCRDGTLRGIRDGAILSLAFASGGRRRSEVAALQVGDVEHTGASYLVNVRRSKTDQAGKGLVVPVRGEAADNLRAWISESGIKAGPLFRSINKHGQVRAAISAGAINEILKARAQLAGLPGEWSAHGLRAGYVTEAGRQGIPAPEAMALSGHRSLAVFAGYYRQGDVLTGKAGGLLEHRDARAPH